MARMVSEQKMQFYPTHPEEAIKALLMLTDVTVDKDHLFSKHKITLPHYMDTVETYEFLKTQKLTTVQILNSFKSRNSSVIADFFAGEGAWLDVAKRILGPNTVTVANELEEGRADKCFRCKNIDIVIQGAAEDLNFPKASVDLMLFNPPYFESNGNNMAKSYFDMMLERNYLSDDGVIIIVLPKNELELIKDSLVTNFEIKCVFKMHQEEFSKWGQYVVIGEKRYSPLTQRYQERDKERLINRFITSIDEAEEATENFSLPVCAPHSNYSKMELEEYVKSFDETILQPTTTSAIWRQAIMDTITDIHSTSQITMPMSPKGGELCQIISSGYINGEIVDVATGESHIVAGGVREVEATTVVREDFVETTTAIRKSVPFLNVLIQTPTGYVIKELCESSSSIAEAIAETEE